MKKLMNMILGGAVMVCLAFAVEAQNASMNAGKEPEPVDEIRRLFSQGLWAEAIEALEKAEKEFPDDEDVISLRATVAMESGDYQTAMRIYSKLLEKYPGNAALKNNMAWLRIKSQDPEIHDLDKALEEAREAVLAADNDYNLWNTLAEVHLARGDAMKAMRLAVLSRDMAIMAGERDLRIYQDLVDRCESASR